MQPPSLFCLLGLFWWGQAREGEERWERLFSADSAPQSESPPLGLKDSEAGPAGGRGPAPAAPSYGSAALRVYTPSGVKGQAGMYCAQRRF